MRGPITWQSLAAPDLRGVALMMNQAQNSVNSGFGNLTDVLKQREATETANWNQQKTNNTNELFNKLAGYKTPEEYQAALDSGALQQEAAVYGAQVDQAAFRQALDRRMGDLQQRAVQGVTFNNTMNDSKDAPVLDQISALTSAGKHTEAKALASSLIRNQGKAQGMIRDTERADTLDSQRNVKFAQDVEMHPLDLAAKRADVTYKGALTNQANAAAERDVAASDKEGKGSGKQLAAALEEVIQNSPLDAGTMDTYAGRKKFDEAIKDLNLKPVQRESLYKSLSEGGRMQVGVDDKGMPITIGTPVSLAVTAARASSDNWYTQNWLGHSNTGENALQAYKNLIKQPDIIKSMQAGMQAQNGQMAPAISKNQAMATLLKAGAAFDKESEDDYMGKPNPNLNNPTWLAAQRKAAEAKNAKLSEETKRRLGIIE